MWHVISQNTEAKYYNINLLSLVIVYMLGLLPFLLRILMIKRHYQYETCDFPEYRGPLLLYYYYCFNLLRLVIVYMLGLPFLLSVLLTYTYINTCDMWFLRIQRSIVIIISLLRLVIVYMLGLLPFLLKILIMKRH